MVDQTSLVVTTPTGEANHVTPQRPWRRVFQRHCPSGYGICFGECGETDGTTGIAGSKQPLAQSPVASALTFSFWHRWFSPWRLLPTLSHRLSGVGKLIPTSLVSVGLSPQNAAWSAGASPEVVTWRNYSDTEQHGERYGVSAARGVAVGAANGKQHADLARVQRPAGGEPCATNRLEGDGPGEGVRIQDPPRQAQRSTPRTAASILLAVAGE